MRRGFKPMLDLTDYTPADRDQADALEQALVGAGTGETMAAAIARRLWKKGELGLPAATRTDYRRELMRLEGPPWRGGRATVSAIRDKGA